ncbi:hypothetical protein L6452_04932 [Arctium lappa]|uniref:Uncharacterized protein n=1 Tax=Arctium lappa TaxID=4217 RepID=A0ACB9EEY9_ARCLA|nr:hypothetical protein L6452_04932 [Arctium lappa]
MHTTSPKTNQTPNQTTLNSTPLLYNYSHLFQISAIAILASPNAFFHSSQTPSKPKIIVSFLCLNDWTLLHVV